MEKETNYDNDGLDQSEEYFRKKKRGKMEKERNFQATSGHQPSRSSLLFTQYLHPFIR